MANFLSQASGDDRLPDLIRRYRAAPASTRAAVAAEVLQELVLLAEENTEADPAVLCRDCPELLGVLRVRLEQMRHVDQLFGRIAEDSVKPGTDSPSDTNIQAIGPYEVLLKVGEGAMGRVYKARHRDSGEIVAVKLMTRGLAGNRVSVKRFEQEFAASRKIDHPNVVRALANGAWEGQPYLVMEFVDGQSVAALIARVKKLREVDSVRWIGQVCAGLERAHQCGIIHRDIKPENIMLNRQGVAKLADLGLVKDRNAMLDLTRTGRGLGTPHYMAPEQYDAAKTADVRSDIFAIGATLYAMISGEVPYGRHVGMADIFFKKVNNDFVPIRTLVPRISDRTEQAIQRALQADPDARPQSCSEFMHDLVGEKK